MIEQAEKIAELESKIDALDQKQAPKATNENDENVIELQKEMEELRHKLDSEVMKHENTTMELT